MILALLCSAPLIVAPPTPPAAPLEPPPLISTAAPAELPESVVPRDLDAGPKFKQPAPRAMVGPAPVAVPTPPMRLAAPALPALPPAPLIAAAPPAPVRASKAAPAPAKGSFEQRLARVERMLESLLAGQKFQKGQEFHLKRPEMKMEFKELGKEWKEYGLMDQKEREKFKETAKRDAARASEDVKRGTREMDKARLKNQTHDQFREAAQRQLEDLRRQLEHLDRQKEALGRQIEKLERDRQKLKGGNEDPGDVEQEDANDEGQTKEECRSGQ